MQNFLSFWIGLRYIRSRNKQRFLSLLSWISLLGMILGVCALIVVLSVMNGFQGELRGRLLNIMPHMSLQSEQAMDEPQLSYLQQRLLTIPEVVKSTAVITGEVLLSSSNRLRAVELHAVKPEENRIEEHVIAGNWQAFTEYKYGIVMGASLARSLGLALNDKVTLMLPEVTYTPFGARPRVKQFRLLAVFEVGADVDNTMVFIRFNDGKRLYGMYRGVTQMQVLIDDALKADVVAANIKAKVLSELENPVEIMSWSDQRSQLFAAVKMEKIMVSFMLSLVILVAAFNLLSVLSMMVAEKRLDISVLRVMGLSRFKVMGIFFTQGMSLAVVSLFLGTVLGITLALNLTSIVRWLEGVFGFYVFDPSVFYITGLPSDLNFQDVFNIVVFSFCLSALFCLYPAYRASRIKPIEAMRV